MSITRRLVHTMRDVYRRMFQRQEDARTREVADVLKQVSLFSGFSRAALRELADVMHRRDYRRDEFLYYENDPGLGLYVVERGSVRLLTDDEKDNAYELRQAQDHEFFGEISLLGDFRRLETAQAITETNVLGFFTPDLKTLLQRNPSLGAAVVAALARHVAAKEVMLLEHMAADRGKVAARRLLDHVPPPIDSSSAA